MARKRQGVTYDNAKNVYKYFSHVLSGSFWQDSGSLVHSGDYMDCKAEKSFKSLESYPYCDVGIYQRSAERLEKAVKSKKAQPTIDIYSRGVEAAKVGDYIVDISALEIWVQSYVTELGWKRCLNNLRQQKFTEENRFHVKQVKIERALADRLAYLAEERNLSLDDLLGIFERNIHSIKELKKKL